MVLAITCLLLAALVQSTYFTAAEPFWNSSDFDERRYGAYPHYEYGSFDLISPRLNIIQWAPQCEYGNILISPKGLSIPTPIPMILDSRGNLVWSDDKWGDVENLRIQSYNGEEYLTFWAGTNHGPYGHGKYFLLDTSYEERYIVEAVGREKADFHEFSITPDGTALLTIYETIPWDLRDLGVRTKGYIIDSIFQEVDIASGHLLFEWRASEHFPVVDSLAPILKKGSSKDTAFDYFHINSIDKDKLGNYWISSRFFSAIYCISAEDGLIVYTLGGTKNDFVDLSDGRATNFNWQHHVTLHQIPGDAAMDMTLLDNGAYNIIKTANESRALSLRLNFSDPKRPTIQVLGSYTSPIPILAKSQGSAQLLPPLEDVLSTEAAKPSQTSAYSNKALFIGWGFTGAWTQFDLSTGDVLCHVHIAPASMFGDDAARSYRAYKYLRPWAGRPKTRPNIGKWLRQNDPSSNFKIYASWNGWAEDGRWLLQGSKNFTGGENDVEEPGWDDVAVLPKEAFEVVFDLTQHTQKGEPGAVEGIQVQSGYTFYRVLALPNSSSKNAASAASGFDDASKALGVSYTLNILTGIILPASSLKSDSSPMNDPTTHLKRPRDSGQLGRDDGFPTIWPVLFVPTFLVVVGCLKWSKRRPKGRTIRSKVWLD